MEVLFTEFFICDKVLVLFWIPAIFEEALDIFNFDICVYEELLIVCQGSFWFQSGIKRFWSRVGSLE